MEELKEHIEKNKNTNDYIWIMLLLLLGTNVNSNRRFDEEIKMKEDIAELKGKMSIIEKML